MPLLSPARHQAAASPRREPGPIAASLFVLGSAAIAAAGMAGLGCVYAASSAVGAGPVLALALAAALVLLGGAGLIWAGGQIAALDRPRSTAGGGADADPSTSRRDERRNPASAADAGRYRAIIDAAREAILIADAAGTIESCNPSAEAMTGYDGGELVGRNLALLLPAGHRAGEVDLRRKDGKAHAAELTLVEGCADGRAYVAAILRDRTARRRREARGKQEERLRHAQKMDALGHLTGGIVHDFNNLLLAITLNLESLGEEVPRSASTEPLFDNARQAIDQARGLVGQLLAFARRQPLAPTSFDLNRVVLEVRLMLRRTLPANIEIEAVPAPDADPVFADPGQLETALLNLAINARDAMPAGGRLTIETANVTLGDAPATLVPDAAPGRYVMIAVTDTGSGMPPEIAARAFEPFFTTKEGAEHSGLGLSQVYGYVTQSGGHVALESTLGGGTTVRLLLPGSRERIPAGRRRAGPARAGGESVLLVEDIPLVRSAVSRMLVDLGYRVTAVANGEEALALIDADSRIDLLFTDMVLNGGLGGEELATLARRRRPGLRVLFTSGYSEVHAGDLAARHRDCGMIGKPYTKAELAERLHALLDAAPAEV